MSLYFGQSLLGALEELRTNYDNLLDAVLDDNVAWCQQYIEQQLKSGKKIDEIVNEYNSEVLSTPLTMAAMRGKIKVLTLFLEVFKANPLGINIFKATPLDRAAYFNQIEAMHLLMKHGASVNISDIAHIDMCESMRSSQDTPLKTAQRNNHFDFAKILIEEYGADISCVITPLHSAAQGGHLGLVNALVNVLKSQKQTLDEVDSQGDTAINLAKRCGHEAIVKHLRECGAREPFDNPLGESAFASAQRFQEKNCLHVYNLIKDSLKESDEVFSPFYLELKNRVKTSKVYQEKKAEKKQERYRPY